MPGRGEDRIEAVWTAREVVAQFRFHGKLGKVEHGREEQHDDQAASVCGAWFTKRSRRILSELGFRGWMLHGRADVCRQQGMAGRGERTTPLVGSRESEGIAGSSSGRSAHLQSMDVQLRMKASHERK